MIAVDTSVLVPAFIESHPHHVESFALLSALRPDNAVASYHAMAEFYVSMSRLPHGLRISPAQCARWTHEDLSRHVRFMALGAEEYHAVIDGAGTLGLSGAVVYDGLHMACAAKAGASLLYTWNIRDFERLLPLYPIKLARPPHA